ncbi:hypothetical protein C7M84_005560 [Penaeus vannamei]|uniref:Uncharacterized protein n=1 Tax=Penaeus vannamei TaxID=6689 RepID=A0A3R7QRT6_PENVA|nr:hypothetical protein C7M84_005560 [Penaeus vannamei]
MTRQARGFGHAKTKACAQRPGWSSSAAVEQGAVGRGRGRGPSATRRRPGVKRGWPGRPPGVWQAWHAVLYTGTALDPTRGTRFHPPPLQPPHPDPYPSPFAPTLPLPNPSPLAPSPSPLPLRPPLFPYPLRPSPSLPYPLRPTPPFLPLNPTLRTASHLFDPNPSPLDPRPPSLPYSPSPSTTHPPTATIFSSTVKPNPFAPSPHQPHYTSPKPLHPVISWWPHSPPSYLIPPQTPPPVLPHPLGPSTPSPPPTLGGPTPPPPTPRPNSPPLLQSPHSPSASIPFPGPMVQKNPPLCSGLKKYFPPHWDLSLSRASKLNLGRRHTAEPVLREDLITEAGSNTVSSITGGLRMCHGATWPGVLLRAWHPCAGWSDRNMSERRSPPP